MSAGIAHDLNNMLAAILGQVELLKLRRQDPEIAEALTTLEMAATDGAQTVRRLQDFARQRRQAPLVPVDLGRVVAEAVEITRPRWHDEATRRGADIRVDIAMGTLSAIEGNGPEIREALTNLIFNAVDAMPHGGTLRFSGRQIPDGERDWIELDVQDAGIGIPEDIQGRIFDPFFTTKGLRGIGLGLSVVYGIMERHGGRVTVASTPGTGTTFTLRFRAAAADAPSAQTPAPTRAPSRRLLVIEDEEFVRHTLVQLLTAAGHVVFEAADGPAGLRLLATESVDCVFTDLGMPGMLGWEVASAVKERRPDLPVVLLTGWGEQAAAEVEQASAVDRLLPKPVRLADLLEVIRDLTGARLRERTEQAADHSSNP
jgi:CheY-like chemotaxis protein